MMHESSVKKRDRGRFATNITRRAILYRYWREGKTIRQAALLSRIPEGSVSRYYAVFNAIQRKERPPITFETVYPENKISDNTAPDTPAPSQIGLSLSYQAKMDMIKLLGKDLYDLNALQRVEFLEKIRALPLYPTNEEMRAHFELEFSQLTKDVSSKHDNVPSATGPASPLATDSTKGFSSGTTGLAGHVGTGLRRKMNDAEIIEFLEHSPLWHMDPQGIGLEIISTYDVPHRVLEFLGAHIKRETRSNWEESAYRHGNYIYFASATDNVILRKFAAQE